MTIQQRLKRSNLIMLVVPIAIAGVLLVVGLGLATMLLQARYLPQLGLTLRDLHDTGEQLETILSGLKLFIGLYLGIVLTALLAAVGFTNLYLTRALFAQIRAPMDELMQGGRRIQDGDLDTPIAYQGQDEFKPACDAVDEMAARLKESLARQQTEQQKKQELIAGMSHDLKSPLTAIRAYTEALLEGVAKDEATRQRYLQTIYTKENDLEALVNRLFELSKLGAYPVRMQPLPLTETLQPYFDGADGVRVTEAIPQDMTVQADQTLLGRITANLLDNSRKYGADCVTVTAVPNADKTELTFADNGPGVPPEQLPHLFDAFYRGDAARSNPGSGSGLGLAVVQKAAEQMGGSVYAANVPGGGLRITLTLQTAKEVPDGTKTHPDR